MTLQSQGIDASHDFCSVVSRSVGEPLAGTATRVDVWFLLTFDSEWGAKALAQSGLSQPIRSHLQGAEQRIPNARIQFIKQPGRDAAALRLYVVRSVVGQEQSYAFAFSDYDELLGLNLEAVARGDAAFDAHRTDERLYLVCVNGRRDKCCAKFGTAMYDEMADAAGESAWQTTHLGGHRFAPNMVFLPHGIQYGHALPGEGAGLAEAYAADQLIVERLRGRTGYDAPINAAESFLRRRTGETALDAYVLRGASTMVGDMAGFIFAGHDGQDYEVRVRRVKTGPVWKSCDAEALEPGEHWEEV